MYPVLRSVQALTSAGALGLRLMLVARPSMGGLALVAEGERSDVIYRRKRFHIQVHVEQGSVLRNSSRDGNSSQTAKQQQGMEAHARA